MKMGDYVRWGRKKWIEMRESDASDLGEVTSEWKGEIPYL